MLESWSCVLSDSHGLSILQGTDLSAAGNVVIYQPAVVETFNGKDTKDRVNILILGSDNVSQKSTDRLHYGGPMWAIRR